MSAVLDAPEDQEPQGGASQPAPEPAKGRSSRKALSSLRRELSDKELLSPAVQKLLLDEIDRLESEHAELSGFRTRFYDADKRAAVLDQKNSINTGQEIVSTASITVGGALLGYAPSVWSSQPTGAVTLISGAILVVLGVVAKVVRA
ncbi:MAG: hypothetical protein JNK17_10175 [Hydrogenophaga sp.]|nr:hypothetical protein [Hydrogenophaga sp.]